MIKFFKKIRQKLVSQNKFKKYILYALGEIILVVIGILIALQINNWNNQQLVKQRNINLLEKLIIEAELNIDRSQFLKDSVYIHFLIRNDTLLNITNRGIKESDLNFLFNAGPDIYYFNDLNLNESTFEQMKNTGTLYSIGSDSLISSIQKYYQLCEREALYNVTYSKDLIRLKEKCYDGWFDMQYSYKLNPQKAIKRHQWIFDQNSTRSIFLQQYIIGAKSHARLIINKLLNIESESRKLIKILNNELNTKNE